ncbi:MAG: DoxX family membrane protein [Verrucomicrobia bacterium]|nr:DoxX family membrane protein [Verrucomicrobiota bacterium]
MDTLASRGTAHQQGGRQVKRYGSVLLRLLLGGVFVVAGALKVLDPSAFATDVARYGLVPNALVNLVALALPWIEVLAGALLLAGCWRQPAALVIAVLNVIFLVAISVALARGLEVCGCFGAAVARKASAWTLVEDAVLLAAALWLCRTKGNTDETNRSVN